MVDERARISELDGPIIAAGASSVDISHDSMRPETDPSPVRGKLIL